MKTILLFTFTTLSLIQVYCQANLVFNQVKNTSGTWTTGQTINNLVVPAGKVLKIESATLGYSNSYLLVVLPSQASMVVGNHIVYSGSTFTGQVNMFPLWLSEGVYTINITSSSLPVYYSISGIEFNVVP